MEEEFRRIYDCMRASETVAGGEYFVIHADHLHDFKMAIKNYLENDDKKIGDEARFQYSQIPDWFRGKELINTINENFEKHQKAIYEIIDKLNRTER